MLKIVFLVFFALTVLFNLTSCTPQALDVESKTETACCGDDFSTPTPPN